MKKILVFISLLTMTSTTFGAYTEIECSTDSVFSENSCNQCFDWWAKMQWDHLWLLSDLWMNVSDIQKIVYTEEQVDPQMINLNSWNVNWLQTPDESNFWEYTDEFNALYSDLEGGYILDAWKSVTWLKSSLSHAYNLETNTAAVWSNIGLLVYPITTHNILDDGEITIDNTEHRECVLFTSGEAATSTPVERLPETGPAAYLLIFLAWILGFGVLKFRTRS